MRNGCGTCSVGDGFTASGIVTSIMIKWGVLSRIADDAEDLRGVFPQLSTAKYVGGEGDSPEAFIIGEAPGGDEDIARRPFVGPAGKVLRQLMALANLRATPTGTFDGALNPNCWLTNVVKFRPPKNRTPTPTEVLAFRPLLRREWHAVGRPALIIPVGGVALWAVAGKQLSILRAAGKCHYYKAKDGSKLAIWPMVHPSYGMRSGSEQLQEVLEQDWIKLREWRNANAG